jgi:predicted TIM-barrel fold metal-dependent hydrolase
LLNQLQIFDSHFHIIDRGFPLVRNNGYLPDEFTCSAYLRRMANYDLCGGAIVSGSFQAFDQNYLIDALAKLGPAFVGVTQLPVTAADDEIIKLAKAGVRAVRFNLERGGSEDLANLSYMAKRIYEVAGWHVELYVDSKALSDLYSTLIELPSVSIDHLGLSRSGQKTLLKLVERGIRVKATGFGRVDFDVRNALKNIHSVNPKALMFGTDLPSTRAPVPYSDNVYMLVMDTLGPDAARDLLSGNAIEFYKPGQADFL